MDKLLKKELIVGQIETRVKKSCMDWFDFYLDENKLSERKQSKG